VVKTDVKQLSIVVGVPARHIGWACFCGKKTEKNDGGFRCESCALDFRMDNGDFQQVQSTKKRLGDLSQATVQ
jgi:UDP-2-acetamido-3-amino-2,3-dideoxy-glucuronate N-acetyltransferase